MTFRQRVIGAMLCGTLVAACSDSPAAPAPVAVNIGGAWNGTWTFVAAGVTVTDTVSVTLTQSGTSAGGLWSAAAGPGGQLTLEVGPTITGTVSISQTLLSGVNCTASTTLAGTASSSRVQFTLGALTPAGLCQWATNQQFTFTR